MGIETAQQLKHRPLRGSLFENTVVGDMFKSPDTFDAFAGTWLCNGPRLNRTV